MTFLLSGLFLFCYTTTVFSPFGAAIGLESGERYLTRTLDYYAAARFINTQTPPASRVYILGDQRGYYYQRDIRLSPVFSKNPLTEWANTSDSSAALRDKLKLEGITHILFNHLEFNRLTAAYPTLRFDARGQANWDGLRAKGLTSIYRDRACEVFAL